MPRCYPLIFPLLVLAATPATAPAPNPAAARVLAIRFEPDIAKGDGAGFFSGPHTLVTCRHVLAGGKVLGVHLADGSRADAMVESEDPARDLVTLKVEGEAHAFIRPAARAPAKGDRVRVLLVRGTIQGRVLELVDDVDVGPSIAFTAEGLGPGCSGAAMVDADGLVVGVVRGEADGRAVAVRWGVK